MIINSCPSTEKCPSGWHHYEKTASCYKVYMRSENYWQAVDTCQKVNGSLATFVTNEELQFILKIEVDFDDKVCRDQCKYVCSYPRFTAVCPFLFFFFFKHGDQTVGVFTHSVTIRAG